VAAHVERVRTLDVRAAPVVEKVAPGVANPVPVAERVALAAEMLEPPSLKVPRTA
jgi:hypothetical protein